MEHANDVNRLRLDLVNDAVVAKNDMPKMPEPLVEFLGLWNNLETLGHGSQGTHQTSKLPNPILGRDRLVVGNCAVDPVNVLLCAFADYHSESRWHVRTLS